MARMQHRLTELTQENQNLSINNEQLKEELELLKIKLLQNQN